MSLVWRWSVALVCQLEVLAIIGAQSGRSLIFAVAVLVVLALHFLRSRPTFGRL